MFDEPNLHSLITRESRQRHIKLAKLLRESLLAAADESFSIRGDFGLQPNWRQHLRYLASIAEAQRDWGWWHKSPWSELTRVVVKDSDYLTWLEMATGSPSATPTDQMPRLASETAIRRSIDAAYDQAEATRQKPPNVNEIGPIVQRGLRSQGLEASKRQIQQIANHADYKKRRRPPGKTVASEKNRPAES